MKTGKTVHESTGKSHMQVETRQKSEAIVLILSQLGCLEMGRGFVS